jgi:lipopolysaccharide export system permease protein
LKILDKYILKSFAKTFFTVFGILFLIFILQTVWLFIAELAGKDLDGILILKFLLFKMPNLIPLVLPLSVLLSSIMTFGDLSENYEFAAMKSAGISLKRTLYSTSIFIVILTIATFFFANNIIPYSEYKFVNFRKNIAQKKPAFALAEGQFSTVGTYSIKVEKKLGENGNILKGITIHEKSTTGEGNKKVINAKTGELISNENSSLLKLVLHDGYYYEDIIPAKWEDRNKFPFAKARFRTDVINMDLNKLNGVDMNDESVKNTDNMLNISELKYTLDSLNKNFNKDIISFTDNIYQRTGVNNIDKKKVAKIKTTEDILSQFEDVKQSEIVKNAMNNVTSTIFSIDSSKTDFQYKQKNIDAHWISFYFKFVIAFSCILMFFIGAPLGAIIRKGGLGLPMVFAVLIFIIFHFVNTFGKKLAEEGGISPFVGCWLSTMILGPLAMFLTNRAMNDIGGSINLDGIINPIKSLFSKSFSTKETTVNILDLEKKYLKYSKIAFVFYLLTIVFLTMLLFSAKPLLIKAAIILILLLYIFSFIAHKKTEKINQFIDKKQDATLLLLFLFSLPFYILFYFYGKKDIIPAISEYLKTNKASKIIVNTIKEKEIITNDCLKISFVDNLKKGLIFYGLTLSFLILFLILAKPIINIFALISIIVLYIFSFKAHKNIEDIEKNNNDKPNVGLLLLFLFSLPLLPLFYFYGKKNISKNE